jgi:fluoroacetyl-CoA thioesterase
MKTRGLSAHRYVIHSLAVRVIGILIGMKDSLKNGLSRTQRIDIDLPRTIDFMGDDCRVYGTPFLLYDMEMTCRDILLDHSDAGEDSVGTEAEIRHTAATLLGMWVEITATLTDIDGRAVSFEISARDGVEQVATAKHSRYIVDIEKTAARLKDKQLIASRSP